MYFLRRGMYSNESICRSWSSVSIKTTFDWLAAYTRPKASRDTISIWENLILERFIETSENHNWGLKPLNLLLRGERVKSKLAAVAVEGKRESWSGPSELYMLFREKGIEIEVRGLEESERQSKSMKGCVKHVWPDLLSKITICSIKRTLSHIWISFNREYQVLSFSPCMR